MAGLTFISLYFKQVLSLRWVLLSVHKGLIILELTVISQPIWNTLTTAWLFLQHVTEHDYNKYKKGGRTGQATNSDSVKHALKLSFGQHVSIFCAWKQSKEWKVKRERFLQRIKAERSRFKKLLLLDYSSGRGKRDTCFDVFYTTYNTP